MTIHRIAGAVWVAVRRLVVTAMLAFGGIVALELRLLLLVTAGALLLAQLAPVRSEPTARRPEAVAERFA